MLVSPFRALAFLRYHLNLEVEHGWRRLELLVVVINVTDLILDITVGWFQLYVTKLKL
jgi:hypothetical protein